MGLLATAAATTTTEAEKESEVAVAAPETVEDAAVDESDMDAADTTMISDKMMNENWVGRHSNRICAPLGTSVVNLNQCCSINAGPIDSTNIKKCCLPERKRTFQTKQQLTEYFLQSGQDPFVTMRQIHAVIGNNLPAWKPVQEAPS